MKNKTSIIINQKIKKDKRKRGDHSTKCKCPKPEWFAPANYKSLPGEFGHAMRRLVIKDKESGKSCLRRRISRDPYFLNLRKIAGRKRDFRPDKRALIDAIFPLLIQKADIGSWIVTTNITKLANELSPKNENKDVIPETRVTPSRLSRLFPEMVRYGLCELPNIEWDPVEEYWIPRHVILTERFWKLCGININKLLDQRNRRLKAESKGILEPGNYISLKTARAIWLEKMRLATIKYRREKAIREKRRKRLTSLPLDQRRYIMASWIINTYPNHILLNMDPESFDRLVWKNLNQLKLGIRWEPGPDKSIH
ncbi:replication initiation protein (plasmid) [Candidatus Pantoea edessiphila]|uniref:Replication initiation protein n=1 Tax=Candidatus Pantoea edessiphila TaxID=2044610 RepID=A0A2P5T161_9GAMM|nr:plasmid replication initiator RepA [Candidatus Pantoea edessiphila]PPI88318.1 replication initiation protein [Candidatus Pantoea edessiphila]